MKEDKLNSYTLKLGRQINTNIESAYDAFTQPELLSKWFITSAEADLRVGRAVFKRGQRYG